MTYERRIFYYFFSDQRNNIKTYALRTGHSWLVVIDGPYSIVYDGIIQQLYVVVVSL